MASYLLDLTAPFNYHSLFIDVCQITMPGIVSKISSLKQRTTDHHRFESVRYGRIRSTRLERVDWSARDFPDFFSIRAGHVLTWTTYSQLNSFQYIKSYALFRMVDKIKLEPLTHLLVIVFLYFVRKVSIPKYHASYVNETRQSWRILSSSK